MDRPQWKTKRDDHALILELQKLFIDAPAAYWESLVGTKEACLFRVVPWAEHVGFSQARPQLMTDPLTWIGFQPCAGLKPSPQLGADTFSVLHSMGIGNKELTDYMSQGVLAQTVIK